MLKEVLEKILYLLPSSLSENEVFENIEEALLNEIPIDMKIGFSRLAISPSLYYAFIKNNPELSPYVIKNESETSLTNITIFPNQGLITLRIRDYGDLIAIKLNATSFDGMMKNIDIAIFDDTTLLETTFERRKEDKIVEYDYNKKIFEDGNEIELDTEQEKDINFSQRFYVPLQDARKYRLNFKKYADFLNVNRDQEQKRELDINTLDNLFTSPFALKDLEDYIKKNIEKDLEEIYDINETIITVGKLDNIIKEIEMIIGKSDEIIMSNYLYLALEAYSLEIPNSDLYNKGVIIKKLNDKYTLYYLHIENDKAIGTGKEINEEEIKAILKSNPNNYEVEGLLTFFNLGYQR